MKEQLYILHKQWDNCTRCPLGTRAYKHILYDLLPRKPKADTVEIMFVGEGPGKSEDVIGKPFIGPAGILLRRVLKELAVGPNWTQPYRICITNLVACRPADSGSYKERQPSISEVAACEPRLVSLLQILQPIIVVALGEIPQIYMPATLQESGIPARLYAISHPSSIERKGGTDYRGYPVWRSHLEMTFRALDQWIMKDPERKQYYESRPSGEKASSNEKHRITADTGNRRITAHAGRK